MRLASLSIFFPCRNEAAAVERVVREAVRVGRRVADTLEVIVVDDASTDATPEIVARLSGELPEVRTIRNDESRGYGAALRAGFSAAKHEWIFYTDGDGQYDLGELPRFVARARDKHAVIGFRRTRGDGIRRALMGHAWSRLAGATLRLPVRDIDCAFKLVHRDVLRDARFVSIGAGIDAELLVAAKRAGHTLVELPVSHFERVGGASTGNNPRVIARGVFELAKLTLTRKSP